MSDQQSTPTESPMSADATRTGATGASGASGTSSASGTSGASGASGTSSASGTSGASGLAGAAADAAKQAGAALRDAAQQADLNDFADQAKRVTSEWTEKIKQEYQRRPGLVIGVGVGAVVVLAANARGLGRRR